MSDPSGRPRDLKAILDSPSYRMAEEDSGFLESEGARASRLALEFMRVDSYLRQHRINSTVVVFGSSHIDASNRYYEEARSLGHILAQATDGSEGRDFVIVTGGGPGIMEAANRGAAEAGAPTIGFNIQLPVDQPPNPYITPTLAFRFHYFALRKMHFLLRARALVAFPGGYGTLDELFESLNLVVTGKIHPIPIVLVGAQHWRRVVDFDYLVNEGFVDAQDRELAQIVETGAEAARLILDFYHAHR
jgi:uncharacterized protein (TIGR00730 family)